MRQYYFTKQRPLASERMYLYFFVGEELEKLEEYRRDE